LKRKVEGKQLPLNKGEKRKPAVPGEPKKNNRDSRKNIMESAAIVRG